ncbi:MAG: helix-turn-helix domain-containing protein [Myxococcaceae bacterium]
MGSKLHKTSAARAPGSWLCPSCVDGLPEYPPGAKARCSECGRLLEPIERIAAALTELVGLLGDQGRSARQANASLLSKRQAARLLGIDRGQKGLDRLVASGQLRTVKRNGRLAIPATAIAELAERGFDVSAVAPRKAQPPPMKPVNKWRLNHR